MTDDPNEGPLWPRPPIRRLPRTIRPVQDETVSTFVQRLADANHWPVEEILYYLCPNTWPENRTPSPTAGSFYSSSRLPAPELPALAAATGLSTRTLAYALPGIRGQHPIRSATLRGRTVAGYPNEERAACRRCIAAKGISARVWVWMRHDQNVCLRHRLWIGPGAYSAAKQVDLTQTPEVVAAQLRHSTLIKKLGRQWVYVVGKRSFQFVDQWTRWNDLTNTRAERLARLGGQETRGFFPKFGPRRNAALYPEAVGLISVLADPRWRLHGVDAEDEEQVEQLATEIRTHAIPEYQPGGGHHDPIFEWLSLLHYTPKHRDWDLRDLHRDLEDREIVRPNRRRRRPGPPSKQQSAHPGAVSVRQLRTF